MVSAKDSKLSASSLSSTHHRHAKQADFQERVTQNQGCVSTIWRQLQSESDFHHLCQASESIIGVVKVADG